MSSFKNEHHDHHDHHDHHGHHDHHRINSKNSQAFFIAIFLNSLFLILEVIFGFIANSTALLADAGHNLSDVLGLVLSLSAAIFAKKVPNKRFTYGLRSSSILAALANSMFLLLSSGAIAWEAIQRLSITPQVSALTVSNIAFLGIVVNGFSAWLFIRGNKNDLNIKAAYLHMLSDAVISFGVVASGIIMHFTGFYFLDPIISIVIVMFIVYGTWGLLRDAMHLALNAVPQHIDLVKIEQFLKGCKGVYDIHDLHIWGISTTESALSVHLVLPEGYPGDEYVDNIMSVLKDQFKIQHSTIQIEQGTTTHNCSLS